MSFAWGSDGHWRLLDAGGPDGDSRFQHSLVCSNDNWAALVCDDDLACRWLSTSVLTMAVNDGDGRWPAADTGRLSLTELEAVWTGRELGSV